MIEIRVDVGVQRRVLFGHLLSCVYMLIGIYWIPALLKAHTRCFSSFRVNVGHVPGTHAGVQEHLTLEGPKQTRLSHSSLIRPKGRDMSVDKTKKEFFSGRPTLGRWQTIISEMVPEMLKLLPGFHKENVGQRQVHEAQISPCYGVSHRWGLADSEHSLLLEGVVLA